MAEYIKKDELLKFKADVYDEDGHVLYAVPTGCIVAMPPADVMPVRHGRWEFVKKVGVTNKYKCSLCGRIEFINESIFYNMKEKMKELYPYCHCGADMRGKYDE